MGFKKYFNRLFDRIFNRNENEFDQEILEKIFNDADTQSEKPSIDEQFFDELIKREKRSARLTLYKTFSIAAKQLKKIVKRGGLYITLTLSLLVPITSKSYQAHKGHVETIKIKHQEDIKELNDRFEETERVYQRIIADLKTKKDIRDKSRMSEFLDNLSDILVSKGGIITTSILVWKVAPKVNQFANIVTSMLTQFMSSNTGTDSSTTTDVEIKNSEIIPQETLNTMVEEIETEQTEVINVDVDDSSSIKIDSFSIAEEELQILQKDFLAMQTTSIESEKYEPTFKQKILTVLEKVKEADRALGKKIYNFLNERGISIDVDIKVNKQESDDTQTDPSDSTPDKKHKSEQKRYALKTTTIFGPQIFPLDLENYQSADSAKIPGLKTAPSLGMGPSGVTGNRSQAFIEIDEEDGTEKRITDQEMEDILQEYHNQKEISESDSEPKII